MKYIIGLYIFLFSGGIWAQDSLLKPNKEQLSIGEILTLRSEILKEDRTINIYLPASYHPDSSKRYPVIYLLDGSIDEDFIHIVGLVQFGSFSWINMLPESIVVGIANIDRRKDFTYPSEDPRDHRDFPTSGKSETFIQFIEEELRPLIEASYTCNSTQTLIGQSLGGLLATDILFQRPRLFDHYIIVSPSLWWDNESLLAKEVTIPSEVQSVYVAVGKEGPVMERLARQLHVKLMAIQPKTLDLYFRYFEKQNHGDALHLAVYDAFEKIFELNSDK